jgi:hypothetical protein
LQWLKREAKISKCAETRKCELFAIPTYCCYLLFLEMIGMSKRRITLSLSYDTQSRRTTRVMKQRMAWLIYSEAFYHTSGAKVYGIQSMTLLKAYDGRFLTGMIRFHSDALTLEVKWLEWKHYFINPLCSSTLLSVCIKRHTGESGMNGNIV